PLSILWRGELSRITASGRARAACAGREHPQPRVKGQLWRGDARPCTADIARARRALGFASRIAWEQGLHELLEWCRGTASRDHFGRAQGELERHGLLSRQLGPAGGGEPSV